MNEEPNALKAWKASTAKKVSAVKGKATTSQQTRVKRSQKLKSKESNTSNTSKAVKAGKAIAQQKKTRQMIKLEIVI